MSAVPPTPMERHLGTGWSLASRHALISSEITFKAHHRDPSDLPILEPNLEGLARSALSSALLAGARTAVTPPLGRPLKLYLPCIHEMGLSARATGAGVVVVVVLGFRRLLRE